MLKSIGALVLLASATSAASATDDIHIWVRGFIPDSSPTAGVLRASDGGCIATDHRGWSESIDAPARVRSDFHLVLSESVPVLRPALQKVNSASPVHQVDCQSMQELAVVPAQLLADDVGIPAQNQAKTLITVLAAIPDPQRAWSSSTINYGATFTYDRATQTLEYQASTGSFPAYEAYATLNDGPVVTVFRSGPLQRNESTESSPESSKVQLQGSVSLSAKRPKAPTNLTIQ